MARSKAGETPISYLREEVDLFGKEGYDVTVMNSSTAKFFSSSNLRDTSAPISFICYGTDTHYVDLAETRLYLRLKVTKPDGTAITDADVVAPANNILHSLFSQVKLYINETAVTPPSNYYGYKAFIERVLLFSKEFNKTQSISACYYKELDPAITTATDADSSYGKRVLLARGGTFEVCGRPHLDLFAQNKYLPPSFDMRIEFVRQPDSFSLHTSATAADGFKLSVEEAYLTVTRRKLLPTIEMMHINAWKQHKVMNFDMKKTDVKSYTVAVGSLNSTNENVITGLLPNRLVIGIVETSNLVGTYKTNPFYFGHHNLSHINVTVNGSNGESFPLDLDFTTVGGKRMLEAYDNVFKGLGICNSPNTIDFTLDEFKTGKTLFVYEISPFGDVNSIPRFGSLKVELKFQQATTKSLTVLCYTESQAILHIDHLKNVYYKDYSHVG